MGQQRDRRELGQQSPQRSRGRRRRPSPPIFISATALPAITTNTAELRLNGKYAIRTGQSLRVAYAYLRMRSDDWVYEGMQFGSLSAVLPTNEQPFNYW